MSRVFLCVIGAIVSATLVSAGSCQVRCANAYSSQAYDAFRLLCVDSAAPNDFVVQVVDSKTLKCNSLKQINCNNTDIITTCQSLAANLQSSYPALGTCGLSMEDCVGGSCQVTCTSLGQAAINSWRPTCISQKAYNVYVTSNSIKCTWSDDVCNKPNFTALCNGVASDFNSGGTSTGCTATVTDCAANPTASPPISSSSDPKCFPAIAKVQLQDGSVKTMAELKVGDMVHVGRNQYSKVFMFSHRMSAEESSSAFVSITTSNATKIQLTGNHYLYVNGALAAAHTVRVGDKLVTSDGSEDIVKGVENVWGEGLYNPHTMHGDIAVDGIITSCYTTAIHPTLAHAALWPVRALFAAGVDIINHAFDKGSDLISSILPNGPARM